MTAEFNVNTQAVLRALSSSSDPIVIMKVRFIIFFDAFVYGFDGNASLLILLLILLMTFL